MAAKKILPLGILYGMLLAFQELLLAAARLK
jgi:hypothetical protein